MTERRADDPVPVANGVPAWLQRFVTMGEVANKIVWPPVLLILGIATYYGWLTSPLATTTTVLAHDRNMETLVNERLRVDAEVLMTIKLMQADMIRNSQAYRIRICSEIRDADVRKRCLET